jgi:hypothetical protein
MVDTTNLLTHLARDGLLLQQDKKLPSVVGLVAGGAIATSWWNHPKAHYIFQSLGQLLDHPDVLVTRLIGGKVTYLHRTLWPAFLAVATSGEEWQYQGLSADARKLLRAVQAGDEARATGEPARELQQRLLVYAEEVHTEAGRHVMLILRWSTVLRRAGSLPQLDAAQARQELEHAAETIGARRTCLPWHRFARRVGKRPRA